VNVRDLLSEVIEILAKKSADNNIDITSQCTEDVPHLIMADSMRLRQLILNLASNAVKFTSNGKITIRAKKKSQEKDNVLLRFEVEDTGIGIPKDKQEYIFEKFTQVDSSSTRKLGGVGLGLSICKTLVAMMGGKIGVISEVGKGSVFWVEIDFPVCNEDVDESENGNQKIMPKFKANILIAEDISDNSYVLKVMLQQMGCNVEIASNGEEAVKKIEENKDLFNIILMDCQMPVMDGYAATRIIRQQQWGKSIPIIAVTGNALQDNITKCIEVGMNDCITKPITFAVLENILRKYTG